MNELLNSRESEVSILGSVMYDGTLLPRLIGLLSEDDFYYGDTKTVYGAMIRLFTNNVEVNVKTVWNELYKQSYEGITETELRGFLDYRVSGETVMAFAVQIAEFSGFRTLEFELGQLSKELQQRNQSLNEYTEQLSSLVQSINGKGVKQQVTTGADLMKSYIEMLYRGRNSWLYTGVPEIDTKLVDFDSKEISYLAARPGTGKTAMMLQSARVNLEKGAKIGFLSMEMESAKLLNRLVAARAKVDGAEILRMGGDEFQADEHLMAALLWYSEQPFFVDDVGPFNSNTVPQKIRKLVYDHHCDIVYVDYIGLIGAAGQLATRNRNEQLSQISRELKNVASELNIPLVIASQLNRDVVKRSSTGRPNLADLRDSGSLEQDASIVAFLYHDLNSISDLGLEDVDEYLKDQDEVYVKLEIAKQRNGPVFTNDLVFKKNFGIFEAKSSYNRTF